MEQVLSPHTDSRLAVLHSSLVRNGWGENKILYYEHPNFEYAGLEDFMHACPDVKEALFVHFVSATFDPEQFIRNYIPFLRLREGFHVPALTVPTHPGNYVEPTLQSNGGGRLSPQLVWQGAAWEVVHMRRLFIHGLGGYPILKNIAYEVGRTAYASTERLFGICRNHLVLMFSPNMLCEMYWENLHAFGTCNGEPFREGAWSHCAMPLALRLQTFKDWRNTMQQMVHSFYRHLTLSARAEVIRSLRVNPAHPLLQKAHSFLHTRALALYQEKQEALRSLESRRTDLQRSLITLRREIVAADQDLRGTPTPASAATKGALKRQATVFQRLVSHGPITNYEFSSHRNRIRAWTEDLIIHDDEHNFDVPTGKYIIELDLTRPNILLKPAGNNTFVHSSRDGDEVPHPHVSSNHAPCLGNLDGGRGEKDSAYALLYAGEYASLIMLMVNFLKSYNDGGVPYASLRAWDATYPGRRAQHEEDEDTWSNCYEERGPVECPDCGESDCHYWDERYDRCAEYRAEDGDTDTCVDCPHGNCSHRPRAMEQCREVHDPWENCLECGLSTICSYRYDTCAEVYEATQVDDEHCPLQDENPGCSDSCPYYQVEEDEDEDEDEEDEDDEDEDTVSETITVTVDENNAGSNAVPNTTARTGEEDAA